MTQEETLSIEDVLSRTPPFSALPEAERASTAKRCQVRAFRAKETVFSEGEAAAAGWLVLEGRVRILGFMGGDRQMELETLGEGDLFGLFCRLGSDSRNYPCTAVTESAVRALRVPDPLFEGLYARFPPVSRKTCELCAGRLRQLRGLLPFARESAERRVVETLLELSRKGGPRVRATRQSLAIHVGATIETVFRVLARLRAVGLVRTERGVVVIERPEALARRLEGLR